MKQQNACPCGSQHAYSECCELYITQQQLPDTPEALMRSRFSAYATKAYQYIIDTYAAEQRAHLSLEVISAHDEGTNWKRLEVINASPSQVEFKAFYIRTGKFYCMHERSEFVKENHRWRYLKGDIQSDSGKVELGRNSECLCGSGKKFKRCCG